MFGKTNTYSAEKISDIFLKRLYKLHVKNKKPEFLDHILDTRKIYYDKEIIDNVTSKLLDQELIEQAEGFTLYGYGKRRPSKRAAIELSPDEAQELIDNLEGAVSLFVLTKKGRNFVLNGQAVDQETLTKKRALKAKWVDRLISFILGVFATVLAAWLISEFIK